MDNKRSISISLEKAKEWYDKGGELKEIALQAFTELELHKDYYGLYSDSDLEKHTYSFALLKDSYDQVLLEAKLQNLANILNGDWKPYINVDKYFIYPSRISNNIVWQVRNHCTVWYPGIAYFKSEELAIKAYELLKEEFNNIENLIHYGY